MTQIYEYILTNEEFLEKYPQEYLAKLEKEWARYVAYNDILYYAKHGEMYKFEFDYPAMKTMPLELRDIYAAHMCNDTIRLSQWPETSYDKHGDELKNHIILNLLLVESTLKLLEKKK